MNAYNKVLVALDVYSEYQPILDKALTLAGGSANVHLIYVTVPMVNYQPYGMAYDSELFNDILQQSKTLLHEVGGDNGIADERIFNPVGSPADEIHEVAEQIEADLIVIGTHGQSGFKLLLGSTANGVLHGVKCDVLAVKI